MSPEDSITYRDAVFDDAPEIANVHIRSWQEAYKGLLPHDFLDQRHLLFKNRLELWKALVADPSQKTIVAENPLHGVVGFINGGPGRDEEKKSHLEIYCLYLLKHFWGKKIGFQLLKRNFRKLWI